MLATRIAGHARRDASRAAPIPSVHRRALLTWVAVYASITSAQALLGDVVAGLPLPVRTLLLAIAAVPLVVYLLVPALLRVTAALSPYSHHKRHHHRYRR